MIQVPYQKDEVGIVKYPIATLRSKAYNRKKRDKALELVKNFCSDYQLTKEYVSNSPSGAYTTQTSPGNYSTTYYSIPYGFIEFKCK